ncbi:hypothetical protein ANCDUO_18781 [Ancylostoma duodenale]|uniref:Uncharacterized protein n=1 Tax=Ancylostoma duodenale TaxID=51022 RepID=A0A0C2FRD5_9BILA|nr:hypothetical protein ANCDUO_18781 [Ancylostoma duodenale]
METPFEYVDEILATEEMFLMLADKHSISQQKANNISRKQRNNQSITATQPLMSDKCIFEDSTTECKGRLCFNCNGAHHTSCCFKAKPTPKPPPSQHRSEIGNVKINNKGIYKAKQSCGGYNPIRLNPSTDRYDSGWWKE